MRTLLPGGPSEHLIVDFLAYLADPLSDGHRAESTIETYRDALRVLDRDLSPHGIASASAEEINAIIKERPKAADGKRIIRKAATRKLYRSAVSAFFVRACSEEDPWLDFNPTPWLTPHKAPRGRARSTSTAELHEILDMAAEPYRTWYVLGAGGGLRAVEISRLDREDIDVESMLVHGKGGVDRSVPTHPVVWQAVRRLPRGPIALDRFGRRATRQGVDGRGNYHLQKTLRYTHWSMHDFRRWYGTNVHELAGGDIRISQELLGHASPATTAIYVDVLSAKKSDAVRGLLLS